MSAFCPAHEGESVVGTCDRCGNFVCRLDSTAQEGRRYCLPCTRKYDVDWLDAFRRELWGRRDGWAYFYGIFGTLGYAGTAAFTATASFVRPPPYAELFALCLAGMAVNVAYFFRARWARIAVVALPLAWPVLLGSSPLSPVIPMLIGLAAYQDARSRLFFKIDVPEEKIRKIYDIYRNNQLARLGFTLALIGILVPGFALAALPCSIVGLRRVDPNARPPVGRKGHAIAGIALSILGILGWALLFLRSARF